MIREAEKKDIYALKSLFEELNGHEITLTEVENRLNFVASSPIDFLFVYELATEVIGLMGFRIRENIEEISRFGEISLLVVNLKYRKQGFGQKMMEFAENLALKKNCKGTWLVSGFSREEQAHPFYKSLGYEITGYRFVKMLRL